MSCELNVTAPRGIMNNSNKKHVLAVMQPTYLPWLGYFNLIHESDTFIFLDDAKLEKSSWHTRNKLLVNGKGCFITVTLDASRLSTINEARLSPLNWRKKHVTMLNTAYRNSPHGKAVLELISPIIENEDIQNLAELNIQLITAISGRLGLMTNFKRSSELNVEEKRSERLMKFCQRFESTIYLSPIGAKEYIVKDGVFNLNNFPVRYQDFPSKEYRQLNSKEFISHLYIVDTICNLGFERTADYVKNIGSLPLQPLYQ